MKISEKWLREWVSPKQDVRALADCLSMAGLETGAIEPVAPNLEHVVVGEIVSLAAHPDADKLKLCRVSVGSAKLLDIVCGAANAAAGMKVAVALEGAMLPGGIKIKPTVIRGAASSGMLCSAKELGLAESADGLLPLDGDAKPGMSIVDYLGLKDVTLEIDLTPNRGDCLSIAGIAREVAALTNTKIKSPVIKPVVAKCRRKISVKLDAGQDCPRYVGRVIADINPSVATPLWMKEKLRRGGVRSIHPVVDVTNYVMLELGQPMHAFDLDKLHGGIHVRHAEKNESLELLDGKKIKLDPGSLLIADDHQPLALAGIMGGLSSAVSSATQHLFLESAWFRPETISVRARAQGLQTDSSQRFERGVDPELPRRAMERATALLLAITGGKPGPVVEQTIKRHVPHPVAIHLRAARIEKILGMVVRPVDTESILKRLGMKLKKSKLGWHVLPPSFRFDITREVDLIEEIARVNGYDKLPVRYPRTAMRARPVSESSVTTSRLRAALVDRGYQEVITYSFVDPRMQALIDPEITPLSLANPISAEMAVMRTSLWPGLLQTILYNQNRQQPRARLFEMGRRFLAQGNEVIQEQMLSGAVYGDALAEQWGAPRREVDFYDVKADIEALFAMMGQGGGAEFRVGQHPALHPGQAAEIYHDGQSSGFLGLLHPAIQDSLGISRPVLLLELRLASLQQAKVPVFKDISRFPSIRRDAAITINESVPAQTVLDCVRKTAKELLVNLELFDEYRGKGIDSGRKSLALALTLQHSSRTLKEEDVEQIMTEVISVLGSELGALPRQ